LIMPSIIIRSPGLLTTVQDTGRFGYQRYGMPVSGAMDTFSMQLANILAGNQYDEACLETTLSGPEVIFTTAGAVAICGSDMSPCINGKPVQLNTTINVKRGEILNFAGLVSGCRAYIAFAGGIDVPKIMGSRSTCLQAKLGGFEGRALKAGDELPLGEITGNILIKKIPKKIIPEYKDIAAIQIIPGPEMERFKPEGIRHFLTSEYTVTNSSDRMGYRLSGKAVDQNSANADIISAGISAGTIQVPGDGQPIILMADRPTTGGYSRIANIISVDLTLAAQLKPGDRIRFSEISLEKARNLFVERKRLLMTI
jgi:antagonist of KipI